MKIEFTVFTKPKGKGRPRFSSRGGFVRAYTDEKTAEYENVIKLAAIETMRYHEVTEKPCIVEIDCYFFPYSKFNKKEKEQAIQGLIAMSRKPDIDNVVKSVLDAINKVVFVDDSQIYKISATKHYSDVEKIVVKICDEF